MGQCFICGKTHKYFVIQAGNSWDTPREILKHLHKGLPGLKEVYNVGECDVILDFCPIVSRAGTDVTAALNELNRHSASKPALLMVLHHTFEREKIVSDSGRDVNRENTLVVNFLFNEDDGLLKCPINDDALTKVIEHFKPQKFFYYIRWILNLCTPRNVLLAVLGIAVVSGIKYYGYRAPERSQGEFKELNF